MKKDSKRMKNERLCSLSISHQKTRREYRHDKETRRIKKELQQNREEPGQAKGRK